MEREDGFSEFDRILMKDVAAMLGASIYDKRLKFASECSSKVAQEILQSMIPPKVSHESLENHYLPSTCSTRCSLGNL